MAKNDIPSLHPTNSLPLPYAFITQIAQTAPAAFAAGYHFLNAFLSRAGEIKSYVLIVSENDFDPLLMRFLTWLRCVRTKNDRLFERIVYERRNLFFVFVLY